MVNCSSAAATNYDISFVAGAVSVAPKTLNVSAANKSVAYGDAPGMYTFVTPAFINGDSFTTTPVCSSNYLATMDTSVSPAVTCAGGVQADYNFNYLPASVNIGKKALNIVASANPTIFGSAAAPSFTTIGLINGDTISTNPDCDTDYSVGSPVGTYSLFCVGGSHANYSFFYTDGELIVEKRTVTITANAATVTYGQGAPSSFSFSVDNLYAGIQLANEPYCSTTYTAGNSVGSYQIDCGGADDANYQVVFAPGTLTVGKKLATVTAPSPSVGFTDAKPGFMATWSGLFGSDQPLSAPTCTTDYTAGAALGSYTVTCQDASAGANYELSYVTGTLTVTRAIRVFTIDGTDVNLDGAIKHVASGTTSIDPIVVATNSGNSLVISGADLLVPGPNTVTVSVLSPTGSNLVEYSITVIVDDPVLEPSPVVIPSGSNSTTVENGVPVNTTTTTNQSSGTVTVGGSDWSATVYGQNSANNPAPLSNGKILITGDAGLVLSGTGYAPNSTVKIYSFSTPVLLGTFTTDANGRFVGTVYLPVGLEAGDHALQMNGVSPNQKSRSVSVAFRLAETHAASVVKAVYFDFKKASVNAAAGKVLKGLKSSLKGAKSVVFNVTGYNVKGHTKSSDIKLAVTRVKNTVVALKKLGISATYKTSTKTLPNTPINQRRVNISVTYTK